MGDYLKLFSTDAERTEYEGSENYIEPYVSYVEGDNTVHYNKPKETRLIVKYGVEDASEPIQLYSYAQSLEGISIFDNIEIDGENVSVETIDNASGTYTFDTVGEHTVKYTLKDPTFIGLEGDIFGEVTKTGATFGFCQNIVSVEVPDSVISIGNYTFYSCSNLTSITIPNSVTNIGHYTFQICGLTSVTIPNSVTSIGDAAFHSCHQLASCTIGSGVTNIDVQIFHSCDSLTSVTVEAIIPPTLGDSAFEDNASGRKIYVPSTSVDAYKAASGWSYYASAIQAIPTA